MTRLVLLLVGTVFLTGCIATVQVTRYDEKTPIRISAPTKIIGLNRVVSSIPSGKVVGTGQVGLGCGNARELIWNGLTSNDEKLLAERFDREVGAAGYRTVSIIPAVQQSGTTEALFGDRGQLTAAAEGKADYLVGAVVRSVAWTICAPWAGFGNVKSLKGEASIEVDWKIYDRAAQRIVAEITTGGFAKVDSSSGEGRLVVQDAFAAAARNLLGSPELPNLVR